MSNILSMATDAARSTLPEVGWEYSTAFCRNRGLITESEQDRLRKCRVAIPGLGGVGGVHLITLARIGVGNFSIADNDEFSVANFNRQYGANSSTIGKQKSVVMKEHVEQINPDCQLRVFNSFIDESNVDEFLEGVDILVDSVDFFAIESRRLLFREARRRGIWTITAGPIGFSTAWLLFDPNGMSFDDYFDIRNGMTEIDKLIAFASGLCPRATQRTYIDLKSVRLSSGAAPSCALACQLASGVATAEVLKILLGRGEIRPAPHYAQFDAYKRKFVSGILRGGNRHPWQRLKRKMMHRMVHRLGLIQD